MHHCNYLVWILLSSIIGSFHQVLLSLEHAKIQPLSGQKLNIANNWSNNFTQLDHPLQGNTLCLLSQSRSKSCVCCFNPVTFHPAISTVNHSSHWNMQKNDANGLLPAREQAQAAGKRAWNRRDSPGSYCWRAAQMNLIISPWHAPHVSRHKGRLLQQMAQLRQGTAGSRGWTSQQSLFHATNLFHITN